MLVQRTELPVARELRQLGDFGARVVLWPFERPCAIIVDHKHGVAVDRIALATVRPIRWLMMLPLPASGRSPA